MSTLTAEIAAFRKRYGLRLHPFLALLRVNGVPTANPVTLARWEKGQASPSAASEKMWRDGMARVAEGLKAPRGASRPRRKPRGG